MLTENLLARGANVLAIEIDRDLAAKLDDRYGREKNFRLVNADVLRVDFHSLIAPGVAHVVGNLPYNISTPLLLQLFGYLDDIARMTFMLQREVVERMCGQPGSSNFGRLSILTQTHCLASQVFEVPPDAFSPPPKVDSAVVTLEPLQAQLSPSVKQKLGELTQAAFSQRRKKIKTGLKSLFSITEIVAQDIDPDLRPDTLGIGEFVRLAHYLCQRSEGNHTG